MTFVGTPEAGYYKRKLVKGGPWVPVRIWFGPSVDPLTGEELDRSYYWQATVNGKPADIWETWTSSYGNPIDEEVYIRMMSNPSETPRQAVSLATMKPVF